MNESSDATAVSLVIKDGEGRYLVVKRPDDPTDDIAGVWGFPAIGKGPDEAEADCAHRVARDKLGVDVMLKRRIGESTHQRGKQRLRLVDYEAVIVRGTPSVPQRDKSHTQYVAVDFTPDPYVVLEAARKGSQCTQIFLQDLGIDWQGPGRAGSTGVGDNAEPCSPAPA